MAGEESSGNGNWEAAMKWQRKLFLLNPGVKSFKVLRDISKKMGLWRIRNISLRINEKQHWEDYISSLKIKYARLPALQDEIKRAGI